MSKILPKDKLRELSLEITNKNLYFIRTVKLIVFDLKQKIFRRQNSVFIVQIFPGLKDDRLI